jgi:hypothetical protein
VLRDLHFYGMTTALLSIDGAARDYLIAAVRDRQGKGSQS